MVAIRALHLISKLCETEREGERAGSKGAYFVSLNTRAPPLFSHCACAGCHYKATEGEEITDVGNTISAPDVQAM